MEATERSLSDDEAWAAVQRRDRSFDGRFVTGVLSTGIYCRPSCAARHPARRNVEFFADGGSARRAGLRACKRCRPDDIGRDEAAVAAVIEAIRSRTASPTLAELAALTGYSASHLQRLFTRHTGLSPAAYARAIRLERATGELSDGASVTDAIFDAGYSSASRFYENSEGRLGMTARSWKNGGAGEQIRWATVPTDLGQLMVAATAAGVCRVSFEEGEAGLQAVFPRAELVPGGEEFADLVARVVAAVDAPGTASVADIPLDVRGTAFQEKVWAELRRIPVGETRSYSEIAAVIGNPKAVRAVGSANGANKVAVLIPCHRVVAADGTLGGYAYGLDRKQRLLDREAGAK